MLREAFGGVLSVFLHEVLDVGKRHERKEFKISLYVRVGGAKEELVRGQYWRVWKTTDFLYLVQIEGTCHLFL